LITAIQQALDGALNPATLVSVVRSRYSELSHAATQLLDTIVSAAPSGGKQQLLVVCSSIANSVQQAVTSDDDTTIDFNMNDYSVQESVGGWLLENVVPLASAALSMVLTIVVPVIGFAVNVLGGILGQLFSGIDQLDDFKIDYSVDNLRYAKPVLQGNLPNGGPLKSRYQPLIDQYGMVLIKVPGLDLFLWDDGGNGHNFEGYLTVGLPDSFDIRARSGTSPLLPSSIDTYTMRNTPHLYELNFRQSSPNRGADHFFTDEALDALYFADTDLSKASKICTSLRNAMATAAGLYAFHAAYVRHATNNYSLEFRDGAWMYDVNLEEYEDLNYPNLTKVRDVLLFLGNTVTHIHNLMDNFKEWFSTWEFINAILVSPWTVMIPAYSAKEMAFITPPVFSKGAVLRAFLGITLVTAGVAAFVVAGKRWWQRRILAKDLKLRNAVEQARTNYGVDPSAENLRVYAKSVRKYSRFVNRSGLIYNNALPTTNVVSISDAVSDFSNMYIASLITGR
jgi:hypothetical protein